MLLSFAATRSLFDFSLVGSFSFSSGYSFLKISKISLYFWRFVSQFSALNQHFSLYSSAACSKSSNSSSAHQNSTSFCDFFSSRGHIADNIANIAFTKSVSTITGRFSFRCENLSDIVETQSYTQRLMYKKSNSFINLSLVVRFSK